MARGEPIWHTSSTGPTSMPSSRDAVATRARRSPERRRVSTMRRRAAERLPWCAATSSDSSTSPPCSRLVGGQALGQLVGHPLGHLARVDEHQGGAMVPRVLGDAVEDVGHLAAAHHRLELGGGELDGHIEVAGVAAVDDDRGRPVLVHARQQPGDHVEGSLGGREPDALQPPAALGHQRIEPLEAEREVAAALVAGERVHLVDDHGPHPSEQRARRRRGRAAGRATRASSPAGPATACAWPPARPAGCRPCGWRCATRGRRTPTGPPPPGSPRAGRGGSRARRPRGRAAGRRRAPRASRRCARPPRAAR